jgi:hypothetical protein
MPATISTMNAASGRNIAVATLRRIGIIAPSLASV